MATRVPFPYSVFNDPYGNPLSNGYITISLSDDAQSPSGIVCRGMSLYVPLDSTGTVTSVPQLWSNSVLIPNTTKYILRSYQEDGQLASGPYAVSV